MGQALRLLVGQGLAGDLLGREGVVAEDDGFGRADGHERPSEVPPVELAGAPTQPVRERRPAAVERRAIMPRAEPLDPPGLAGRLSQGRSSSCTSRPPRTGPGSVGLRGRPGRRGGGPSSRAESTVTPRCSRTERASRARAEAAKSSTDWPSAEAASSIASFSSGSIRKFRWASVAMMALSINSRRLWSDLPPS